MCTLYTCSYCLLVISSILLTWRSFQMCKLLLFIVLLCGMKVLPLFSCSFLLTELMETDLHQVIVSSQVLCEDHIKVFLYQILRGSLMVFSLGLLWNVVNYCTNYCANGLFYVFIFPSPQVLSISTQLASYTGILSQAICLSIATVI